MLIANDHQMVADEREMLAAAVVLRPGVVVLDIAGPNLNGTEAVGNCGRMAAKVVILTLQWDAPYAAGSGRGCLEFDLKHAAATDSLRCYAVSGFGNRIRGRSR